MNRRNDLRSLAMIGAVALAAPTAHADEAKSRRTDGAWEECARQAERGQRLRDAGKLLAAKPLLLECSESVCPAIIRVACERWEEDVVSETPSVIVRARDASGTSVSDVTVRVDGERVAERLDGQPISIDPGSHRFEFSHAGSPLLSDEVVIAVGERDHALPIRFASDAETPVPLAPLVADGGAGRTHRKPLNYPAWTFVGVSLTAVGIFAYLGATGLTEAHSHDVTCGSQCPPSSFNDASSRFLWADVSLGIAAAAAGAAVWFFVMGRDGDAKAATRVGEWTVAPGPHGAAVQWGKTF
jgi:hypothetical protein